jgi:hypothetical protein
VLAIPAVRARDKEGGKSETKIAALRMTVKPYRVNYTFIVRERLLQELPRRDMGIKKKHIERTMVLDI